MDDVYFIQNIQENSSIKDSWMITHECSSIKYEYCAQLLWQVHFTYFPIPLCQMVQVTIWLFCKIHFTWLLSSICQITESTLLNSQVHVAKWVFPRYQLHINKAILPNCEVQIHFVNCPNEPLHKKFLGCPTPQVCWNFCPKTQTALIPPPPFPHPPKTFLSIISFLLDGSLKLERSPFKIQTTL